jgi:hypothetical protein
VVQPGGPAGPCGGALEEREYREQLAKAGFEEIDLEPTRVYRAEDARAFLAGAGLDTHTIAPQVDGKFLRPSSAPANPRPDGSLRTAVPGSRARSLCVECLGAALLRAAVTPTLTFGADRGSSP